MIKFIFYIIMAGACFLISTDGEAAERILLRENFSSYAIGSRPNLPDDGNPYPWSFHPALKLFVKDEPLPPEASEGARILSLLNDNPDISPVSQRLFEMTDTSEPVTELVWRFKLRCLSFERSKYFFYLANKDHSGFGPYLIFDQNGRFHVGHAKERAGGEYDYHASPLRDPLVKGEWYQFEVRANLQTQTFSVLAVNLENSAQQGSIEGLHFAGDLTELNMLVLRPMNDPRKESALLDWEITDLEITTP